MRWRYISWFCFLQHITRRLPSQYKASSFERKNMDVYAKSLMVRSNSGACHFLLADPIGQNSVLWLLWYNARVSDVVFQCTQQENELGLINAYHLTTFPKTHFILSLLHRTFSYLPRRANPEIQSALETAQSPGFLGNLSTYNRVCLLWYNNIWTEKACYLPLLPHTMCKMVRQGQNSHVDAISEKKRNRGMLNRHWSVVSLKHHWANLEGLLGRGEIF